MDYQTLAAIIFIFLMVLFLWNNKKKIYLQKIAFPFLYFAMYRTKLGLDSMESLSKKFPRLLKWIAYAGIFVGFLGMVFISYSLIANLVKLFTTPAATAGVALVLPFKVKGSFYVPFFYWIISIFILAVVHEFSHGVIAKTYGVKIKSSGFAFLGILVPILPAAFVEPDETQLKNKSTATKLSVYAAGPFSNILLAAVVALILAFVFTPLAGAIFQPNGIVVGGYVRGEGNMTFPAEEINLSSGTLITHLNGIAVPEINNFTSVLDTTRPGDTLRITSNTTEYTLTLVEDPQHVNKSYMGIYVKQGSQISEGFTDKYGSIITSVLIWIIGLFYWLYVLNLGIGLFNLVPIGPIDGGRMIYVVLEKYLRKDLAMKVWKFISTLFLLILLISILFAFLK